MADQKRKRDSAFSGPGAFADRNLIVEHKETRVATVKNAAGEERKNYFLNVQADHRDEIAKAALQRGVNNLHASTTYKKVSAEERAQLKAEGKGVPRDNAFSYSESQIDKIREAAGDNVYRDAEAGVTYYAVKGSMSVASNGQALIIDTSKPMSSSDFEISPEAIQGQRDAVVAATALKREMAAQEPAVEAEAPEAAAEVEAEQPEL